MSNFKDINLISTEQKATLEAGGVLTDGNDTLELEPGQVYAVPDDSVVVYTDANKTVKTAVLKIYVDSSGYLCIDTE